jgi:secondary thiamine-phosphate synthase enzyme
MNIMKYAPEILDAAIGTNTEESSHMYERAALKEYESIAWKATHHLLQVTTEEPLAFVDLTEQVSALVRSAGIQIGAVHLQTLHTTTAIVVNEYEPLLHCDMKKLLDRLAPETADYDHDNLAIRTVNLVPDERRNGHAHCRAMFFRTSETIHILDGALHLGRWQRIFMLELDGPQSRRVSAMIMGQ